MHKQGIAAKLAALQGAPGLSFCWRWEAGKNTFCLPPAWGPGKGRAAALEKWEETKNAALEKREGTKLQAAAGIFTGLSLQPVTPLTATGTALAPLRIPRNPPSGSCMGSIGSLLEMWNIYSSRPGEEKGTAINSNKAPSKPCFTELFAGKAPQTSLPLAFVRSIL